MITTDTDKAWELWLERLRDPVSRKHQGGLGSIAYECFRCCLGHACDALGVERDKAREDQLRWDDKVFYTDGVKTSSDVLPAEVAKLLDCTDVCMFSASYYDDGTEDEHENATSLNDDTWLSMPEIADILEAKRAAGEILPYSYRLL